MKREDFDEEELQGKLIAYLDEQLPPAEKAEIGKLISEHDDLKADLEMYRMTSSNLEELFRFDDVQTPPEVEARLIKSSISNRKRKGVSTGKQPTLYSEPKLQRQDGFEAASSETEALSQSISTRPGRRTEMRMAEPRSQDFRNQPKVTPISAPKRPTGPARGNLLGHRGFQLAAALALGVVLGPSVFEQLQPSSSSNTKQAVKLEGLDPLGSKEEPANQRQNVEVESLVNLGQLGRVGIQFLNAKNGKLDFSSSSTTKETEYKVKFLSPSKGNVKITKFVQASETSEARDLLFEGMVNVGQTVTLPKNGSYEISNEIRITFEATVVAPSGDRVVFTKSFEPK